MVVVQLLGHVRLSATPWTVACQASLSFTISQSLLKFMSIASVMPSNHLMLFLMWTQRQLWSLLRRLRDSSTLHLYHTNRDSYVVTWNETSSSKAVVPISEVNDIWGNPVREKKQQQKRAQAHTQCPEPKLSKRLQKEPLQPKEWLRRCKSRSF